MITAIIVDDEPDCSEILATLLDRYCPQVKVIDICYNGQTALKSIMEEKPQLVFLDIEMPQMNGFELLERLQPIHFKLIFTTSYDQYAIKAIKFSALDYLLKPIDREELQEAVRKTIQSLHVPIPQQFEVLLQKMQHTGASNQKIALPTMEGLQLISVDEIISCESERNYTYIYLKSKQKLIISKPLKDIEEMLEDYPFLRVHHSYIVNLKEISKYIRGEGGYLIMTDGSNVDVSRSRKESLIQKLQNR
jgi:two-component system, LytTR family, response regulator